MGGHSPYAVPPSERQALYDRYMAGESMQQIAHSLGISNASVSRYIRSIGDHKRPWPTGRMWGIAREMMSLETDECIIWRHALSNGYGVVNTSSGTKRLNMVAAETSSGPRPNDGQRWEAAHRCGVKACINPRHLRWSTVRGNANDQLILGERLLGEQRYNSRLTEPEVLDIYANTCETYQTLANRYGVSVTAIADIKLHRSWSWLTQGGQ